MEILVATHQGLIVAERMENNWQAVRHSLEGQSITSVAIGQNVVLAGTRHGIYRSADGGKSWHQIVQDLPVPYVRWLVYHPNIPALAFAGTEPAGVLVSHDSGESWRESPEVSALREKYNWYLPYSPGAGCVRDFTFHGNRAYAAVEVGGVVCSDDRGESWQLAAGSSGETDMNQDEPLVHPDVHSIIVHPSSADLVFAPTGAGFFRSADGGVVWERIYPPCYCRAVWVDPVDAEHLVLGPADSVDRQGRIEQSHDGGKTWQAASTGLHTPWPRHMVERFLQVGNDLLAVLSNGELICASIHSLQWERILPDMNNVTAVDYLNR